MMQTLSKQEKRILRDLGRGLPIVGHPRVMAEIEMDAEDFIRKAQTFARTCPRYQLTNLQSNNYKIRADAKVAGFKSITPENLFAMFYALRQGASKA